MTVIELVCVRNVLICMTCTCCHLVNRLALLVKIFVGDVALNLSLRTLHNHSLFGRCRRCSGYDHLLGVCISSSRKDVHVCVSHAPTGACAGHDSRCIDNRRGRHTYKGLRTKGKENDEKVMTVSCVTVKMSVTLVFIHWGWEGGMGVGGDAHDTPDIECDGKCVYLHVRDVTGCSGSVVQVGPLCVHKQIDSNVTELHCHAVSLEYWACCYCMSCCYCFDDLCLIK